MARIFGSYNSRSIIGEKGQIPVNKIYTLLSENIQSDENSLEYFETTLNSLYFDLVYFWQTCDDISGNINEVASGLTIKPC
jgi:hypothetical protein